MRLQMRATRCDSDSQCADRHAGGGFENVALDRMQRGRRKRAHLSYLSGGTHKESKSLFFNRHTSLGAAQKTKPAQVRLSERKQHQAI